MKEILKIQGIQKLDRSAQQKLTGGLDEYVENCGPGTNGYRCFTGLPHCPIGRCLNSVCVPDSH